MITQYIQISRNRKVEETSFSYVIETLMKKPNGVLLASSIFTKNFECSPRHDEINSNVLAKHYNLILMILNESSTVFSSSLVRILKKSASILKKKDLGFLAETILENENL